MTRKPIAAWFLVELDIDSSEPEWEATDDSSAGNANIETTATEGNAAAADLASETVDFSRVARQRLLCQCG